MQRAEAKARLRSPHSSRPRGRCTGGCGRPRRCRCAPPARPELPLAHPRRGERRPARGVYGRSHASSTSASAVCGARRSGLFSRSIRPSSIARISSRIAIIASQKRSSSSRDSLSVGSIIIVPATGQDIVGAWNPKSISRFATSSTAMPAVSLKRPQIEDELVRDEAATAREQDRVVRRETPRHVVRVQDRDLARALTQARRAHQRDVDPGDGQDARAAVGRRAHRADRPPAARRPRPDGPAGTVRGAGRRRSGPCPARPRRAGCRTSCAG